MSSASGLEQVCVIPNLTHYQYIVKLGMTWKIPRIDWSCTCDQRNKSGLPAGAFTEGKVDEMWSLMEIAWPPLGGLCRITSGCHGRRVMMLLP